MKKNTIKKILALAFVLMLLLSICIPVYAEESIPTVAATYTITATVTEKKVTLSQKSVNLVAGQTVAIVTSAAEGVDATLTVASKKESIAYLDANGYICAADKGSTTITVKSANGKKASLKVKVVPKARKSNPLAKAMLAQIPSRIERTANFYNNIRTGVCGCTDVPDNLEPMELENALNRAAFYCLVQTMKDEPDYWTGWEASSFKKRSGYIIPLDKLQKYLNDFGIQGTPIGCEITVAQHGVHPQLGPFFETGDDLFFNYHLGTDGKYIPYCRVNPNSAYFGFAVIGVGEFGGTSNLRPGIYGEHSVCLTMAGDYSFKPTKLSKRWKEYYAWAETPEDIPY